LRVAGVRELAEPGYSVNDRQLRRVPALEPADREGFRPVRVQNRSRSRCARWAT